MFIPDYRTVQLLHQQRAAEMQRKRRGLAPPFDIGSSTPVNPPGRLRQWLRRGGAVGLGSYQPVHLSS